jgi:uncharacterized protein
MSVDYIRYDILTQEALRGVVRTVLTDAAKNGLPGEHHFYVSFDTRAEGVKLSPRMAAQYPQEMTIVLQHQFWDLAVSEQGFEVGLSFNGIPERLVVPYSAIKGFVDPSVQFGLQFETLVAAPQAQGAPSSADGTRSGESARAPLRHDRPVASTSPPSIAADPSTEPHDEPDKPAGGGEVVRLDRFRKK